MLSVIVPTYNESENVRELVERTLGAFKKLPEEAELLIVDDDSPDGTADKARAAAADLNETERVRVIVRTKDRGLAKAVLKGFRQAKGDVLAVMDADLSHPPELLPELLAAIRSENADIAVASRRVAGGGTEGWPLKRRFASWFAGILARPLVPIRDTTSGYFAIRRDRLDRVDLKPRGYKIGLEVFVRAKCERPKEVPFVFRDRTKGRSKLGGAVILAYLIQLFSLYRERFPRLVGYMQFALVGLLGVAVDAAVFNLAYGYLGLKELGPRFGGFLAQTGSFVVAATFNFVLNAAWTFRERAKSARWSVFLGVCALGFVVRSVVFESLVAATALSTLPVIGGVVRTLSIEQFALFAGIFVGSIWNYYGSRRWAFAVEKPEAPEAPPPPDELLARSWTLVLLAALLAFRIFFAAVIDLAEDEAYYWQWSRHLACGYHDHPPMVAYIIAAGTRILGTNELGVRCVTILMSVAIAWMIYRIAREFSGSSRGGMWAAATAVVAPLFAVGALITTPDSPMVFFWTAAVFAILCAFKTGRIRDWLLVGAATGLGMLSKYPMVLLPAALFAALLSTPRGRKALKSPGPYLGALLAAALCVPMLAWNLRHGMASVLFQLGHGLGPAAGGAKSTGGLRTLAEFLGGQVGVASPIIFVLVVWALVRAARELIQWWRKPESASRTPAAGEALSRGEMLPFLLFPALVTFFVFGAASLMAKSEANWPAAAYVTSFVLLGHELDRITRERSKAGRRLAWSALILAAAISVYAHVEATFPMFQYSRGPFEKVRDRGQLARWAERVRAERGPESEGARVLASSYQLASILAFYLPGHPETDAPFEGGSGSAYTEWRTPAGEGEPAWFFSWREDTVLPERLFSEFEFVGVCSETRLSVELRTVRAYYGRLRAGVLRVRDQDH